MMSTKDIDTLFSREQDDIAASEGYIDAARELLEAEFFAQPQKRHPRTAVAVAAGLGVVFAAASVLWILATPETVGVMVEEYDTALEVGSWVAAPKDKSLHLAFSDGSKVFLEANSEVRLQEIDDEGAHLLLERGKVRVMVVHRRETDWRIDAGPYRILVTGTAFSADWTPDRRVFSLVVKEGTVMVNGPMLAEGKALSVGDHLDVSLPDSVAHISKKDTFERIVAKTEDKSIDAGLIKSEASYSPVVFSEEMQALSTEPHGRPHRIVAKDNSASEETWQSLATRGEYVEAVALAERSGFKQIASNAALDDLMLLGDAARLAENTVRATQVYKTVRSRFASSSEAQRAAFVLGRIAFESKGSYKEAARWFEICYEENKDGAMAREAAGRLMEALDRSGDEEGSRAAALTYLKRFRHGPHSKLAKNILSTVD